MKGNIMQELLKRPDLWKDQAGILTKNGCSQTVETEFSDDTQNLLFAIEDCSWWFQYRSTVILSFAQWYMDKSKRIVDIGGGNGWNAKILTAWKGKSAGKQDSDVVLLEPSVQACLNARQRGIRSILHGTLCEEDIKDNSIAQATVLDVLEHIEDDVSFLRLLCKKMSPSGIVLLTVPAFPCLWSSEDDEAGHFRRYRFRQLQETARTAGFEILDENHFFSFLFLPVLVGRVAAERLKLLKRADKRSEQEKQAVMERQFTNQPAVVSFILRCLEKLECVLLQKVKIPFGSSIILILRKK